MQTSRSILSIVLLLLLSLTTHSDAQGRLSLFSPAPKAKTALAPSRSEKRVGSVIAAIPQLRELKPTQTHRLHLQFFKDAAYEVVLNRYQAHTSTRFSWFGHIQNDLLSAVNIVVDGSSLILELSVAGKMHYSVRPIQGDVYRVSESRVEPHTRCGGPVIEGKLQPSPAAIVQPAGTVTIDVYMFYTMTVQASYSHNLSAVNARCQAMIDNANTVMTNTGIDVQFRMVAAGGLPNFDEINSYSDMLREFRNNAYVNSQREAYGADLICLVVDSPEYSGLSITVGLAQLYGYVSVVHNGSATSIYTFAHEVGHNLGCGHASSDPNNQGLYSYSHGYKYSIGGLDHRTVMAYEPGIIYPHFSTPLQTHYYAGDSEVIGNAETADNARTIRETASVIAAFRTLDRNNVYVDKNASGVPIGTADNPCQTIAQALALVNLGGTIHLRANSYNELPRITKAVRIRKWDGSANVVIGSP